MELKEQTERLLNILEKCQVRFETNMPPEQISDQQFFQQVKEETIPIFNLLQSWEDKALHFVKDQDVHVHPHQIVSTKENMELILLHSYYIDARRKRYMELTKSSEYIFDQLVTDINRKDDREAK